MVYGPVMAAVIGMVIGAVTGSIVSFVFRLGIRGVQWDALLGSIGYVCNRILWPGSATNHDVAMTIVTVALAATLPIFVNHIASERDRSNLKHRFSENGIGPHSDNPVYQDSALCVIANSVSGEE